MALTVDVWLSITMLREKNTAGLAEKVTSVLDSGSMLIMVG